jgi:hypothetical protein
MNDDIYERKSGYGTEWKEKVAAEENLRVFDLPSGPTVLLELSLRIHDLFGLHGRKLLGNDL